MSAPETTVVTDGAPDSRPDAGTRLGDDVRSPRRSVAPLLLRLHFYAGILVGPFLVIATLTGLAFALTPTLDKFVYASEFYTDGSGQRRPLSEQVEAAQAARPDGALAPVVLPDGADANTRAVFNVDGLGENQITVFVDPYTSQVKGSLETWFGETPLQTWFDDLHRNLHLGEYGRHYSELAASWLWVVALGGLVHMGLLFGVANQIVLEALAIGLLCVIFSGYRMWWQRRPTRADRTRPLGAPPARSAWQQLPSLAIVVGVPAVLAIGYAMPVLGVSLLAFLATDLVVGAVQRRRTTGIAPVSPAVTDTREPATTNARRSIQ